MSTKTTPETTVTLDVTELATKRSIDLDASMSRHDVNSAAPKEITSVKQEYSIVGDKFYAGVNSDVAPEWLVNLIDSVVGASVANGLTDYDLLVQDVRNAIDSIDVAKNTYVEQVNFNSLVDGIIGSHLTTLNATYEGKFATIVNLDIVRADSESALAMSTQDLRAEFSSDIDARITSVQTAYAAADRVNADSIEALNVAFTDQELNLSGTAEAVTGLQTYVGLDSNGNPNSTGALSRIAVLEKQTDGVIETITDTHDVILNPQNASTAELLTAAEPYSSWRALDAANGNSDARLSHIGDVYVKYSVKANGAKEYIASYKFIKTATDTTSPFSTDAEGFTWAVVVDQAAQDAYEEALNAYDLADGKRRVFLTTPFTPYNAGDLWVDSSASPQVINVCKTEALSGLFNASHWELADEYAKDFVDNTYTPDSAQLHRQLDGRVEYYFYENFNEIAGATSEASALDILDNAWNTQELRDGANGDVVYFKDTEHAFWYQASTASWLVITDTSIYQSLKVAADAQAAADGKVSSFFAWGDMPDGSAPKDYVLPAEEPKFKTNSNGDYVNASNAVVTDPALYVVLPAEDPETVSATKVVMWFTGGKLYKRALGASWATKVAVPTTPGEVSYISEGDLLAVFDTVTGDTTNYWFNGTDWVVNTPAGVISKSKWFVDLENAVTGSSGLVAVAMNNLKITGESYANATSARVENKFSYDSTVILDGKHYKAGFGLDSSGVQQTTDGLTPETAFDSEFWINAERFVLKSPTYPDVSAKFEVTASGIRLGLDSTEATKNEAKGAHVQSSAYDKGDTVLSNGSSYIALRDVPANIPVTNVIYWQLFAQKGDTGVSYTGTTEFYKLTNSSSAPTVSSGSWSTSPQTPTSSNRYLWNYNRNTKSDGSFTNSAVSLITQYVSDGADGDDGDDGRGITAVSESYQRGSSPTSVPSGSWNSSFSAAGALTESLPYMWNRTVVSYSSGTLTETRYTLIAAKGDKGDKGDEGVGIQGTAGSGSYIYITNNNKAWAEGRSTASRNADFLAASGRAAQQHDTLRYVNQSLTAGYAIDYIRGASSWSGFLNVVDGNQLVKGTVVADSLVTNMVIADDATFKGTLDVKSATSGGRLEINGTQILVYDDSGVLRVKLGQL